MNRQQRILKYAASADRRGILLLVVLALLVLFLLVGTSFIVSSSQYRKANKTLAAAASPETAKNPLQQQALLDEVMNQLLRDTNNPYSSLRYHSLLRDLYGEDGIAGKLPNTTDGSGTTNADYALNTGGQLIRVELRFTGTPPQPLRQINGYYNGLVWTTTGGQAKTSSARIVNYHYYPADVSNPEYYQFDLMPLEQASGDPNDYKPPRSERVVLNGRPFNGTGVGYDPIKTTGPLLDVIETVIGSSGSPITPDPQIALMPNATFFDYDPDPTKFSVNPAYYGLPSSATSVDLSLRKYTGLGGSDESYDAVDFQNMFLAMTPVSPIETLLRGDFGTWPSPLPAELGNIVLPSFHRPELINYWWRNYSVHLEPNLLRKVMMRPSWYDHPHFTGSNPELAGLIDAFRAEWEVTSPNPSQYGPISQNLVTRMIYGPWDVDNDNDGRRDSVWIDFGAPVMMSPQGKLVKPLAAVLCVDMDGRLNINAHGSRMLAELDGDPNTYAQTVAGNVSSARLPRGQGYGPAEISLQPVVGAFFPRLLLGVNQGDGRFSDGSLPFERSWPGRYGYKGTDSAPGAPGRFDLMSQMNMQGFPRYANSRGNYATPPDLFGRYSVGLNDLGQPVYEVTNELGYEQDQDSPYELDLSRSGTSSAGANAKDAPFSLGEFERLLRAYDPDASRLPGRLWELANRFVPQNASTPNVEFLNSWRTLLTTDSFDLPVPSVTLPEWMRRTNAVGPAFRTVMGRDTNLTFADLLEYRVRVALGLLNPSTITALDQAKIQQVMNQLLAPELADGLKIDINRALGNGRDDNDNGVVDEPGEEDRDYPFWDVDRTRTDASANLTAADQFTAQRTSVYHDVRDGDGQPGISKLDRGFIETVNGEDPNMRFLNNGSHTLGERVYLQNMRRQLLARHLYVLAMTLVDPPSDPNSPTVMKERTRQLAQWAINVVDFRDPDNIMTGFEYDAKPFDGWGEDPDGAGPAPFLPIDGNLNNTADVYGLDNRPGGTGANADPGGVVWGAERPELIITETLAWHDRKTRTGRREGQASIDELDDQVPGDVGGNPYDVSEDQEFRPEGAGFIELYNPWPAETAANADTHKLDLNGNDLGVNLANVARDPFAADPNSIRSPVWRITVYRNGGVDRNPDDPDEKKRPTNVQLKNIADRTIYFAGEDPQNVFQAAGKVWDYKDGVAFFNDFNPTNTADSLSTASIPVPSVRPGRLMIIGAGEEITPNSGQYVAKFGENNSQSSQRGIVLRVNQSATAAVEMRTADGTTATDVAGFSMESPPESAMPNANPSFGSVTSVAIINRATPTAAYTEKERRFTFSEPPGGYPDSVNVNSSTPFSNSRWDGTRYVPILDVPLDDYLSRKLPDVGGGLEPRAPRSPISDGETRVALPQDDRGSRTLPGFSWVYLQRLANPLLAWNPPPGENIDPSTGLDQHDPSRPVNPYMTLDSMGVNVTVFNGMGNAEERGRGKGEQPLRFSNNSAIRTFSSVQRGRMNDPAKDALGFQDQQTRVLAGKSIREFDPDNPNSTLPINLWSLEGIDGGWVNKGGQMGDGVDNSPNAVNEYFKGIPDCTLGFLNESFQDTTLAANARKTTPKTPFPWITWNNRPYVSAGELLQVPKYSTAELPRAFQFNGDGTRGEVFESDPNDVRNAAHPEERFQLDGPFSHLINFFRTKPGPKATPGSPSYDPNQPSPIVGMYRILDYVGVPSRYAGTETWLNPTSFSDPAVADSSGVPTNFLESSDDARYALLPPFNKVSNYREPGRININTLGPDDQSGSGGGKAVWDAMFHGSTKRDNSTPQGVHVGSDDDDYTVVRRGYWSATTGAGVGTRVDGFDLLNPNFPTLFANPFRSNDSGSLVPLEQMIRTDLDCGLARSFEGTGGGMAQSKGEPFCTTKTDLAYRDSFRNPFFRYQPLSRLESMTTTHSNVYAVWVTIGFFEVEEAPPFDGPNGFAARNGFPPGDPAARPLYDRVYPEGYQLGQEMGSETGDFQRLRGFEMIDRTIPVAFEPGKDNNVEKAVRLKRRIE